MKLQGQFSYANVMSTLAVFIALAGGSIAVAAVGRNDIGSREVDNNSLKSADLKNKKGVKGKDVADGSLTGADVGDGSLGGADITDGSLGSADVADGSLGGADVTDESLGAADVTDGSLGGAEVANDGLTGDDVLESSLAQVPSAASAGNADTVDGKNASELQTSSAFAERTDNLALTGSMQDVLSTNITTTGTRVIAIGSVAVITDGGGDDEAVCTLRIASVDSPQYSHDIAEVFGLDEATLSLTFARELGPGTHAVALRCLEEGEVTVENADLSVWAVGS